MTEASNSAGKLALKMAMVLASVSRVAKNGRNDYHKYDYVTEADLVDHIRDKLAEHKIAIFPSVTNHSTERIEKGNKVEFRSTIDMQITIVDGESGDSMVVNWAGQGMDAGDKAYYKAYTGAMKYFYMKTFMISTGDDPELDGAQPTPRNQGGGRRNQGGQGGGRRQSNGRGQGGGQRKQSSQQASSRSEEIPDDRVLPSMRTMLVNSTDKETAEAFLNVWAAKLNANSPEDVESKKARALRNRLVGMEGPARGDYVRSVLADQAN